LFVGKTLLHGDVLMWLMKTLLTSGCTNQRGAGHNTLSSSIAFCIAVNKYQAQVDKYHDDRKWSWLPFHFKRRSGLESGVASFFGVIFIAKSSGLCRKRINKDEFKL
ncbi:MAG: hypothetical protein E6470_25570, partial [Enterobacteriaceae bacterium]|nr:hypothetical protein [Enterobacteriaceae bacterium]